MKIQYLGHSSFLLASSDGLTIVTDPYSPEVGFRMPEIEADVVTVSHHHFDHDYVKAVGGNPRVIDGAGSYDVKGVHIEGVSSFHDEVGGKKRGANTIFKFSMDGMTVCHFGDIGEPYSKELIEKIRPADVILIPVGGNYTINAKTAKDYVNGVDPKVVIPMHYRVKGGKIDIGNLEQFTDLFDNVVDDGVSQVALSAEGLNDKTRIIVLRRA